MSNNIQKAVIYCRVSSTQQTTKGDGLNSQKTRCLEYAKHKCYEVVQTFSDDLSGALITRPGMKAMISYLNQQKNSPHVVIIDDISRLARDIETHLQLRSAISEAGGKLESPTLEFGEDPDSIFVENLLASVSQHQRQKNAEQTKNRMRARAMNGYWVFHAPLGYKFEAKSGHGKVLVRNEPLASAIQEALEGYASGRFDSQTEVKRFLEQHDFFPRTATSDQIRYQKINNLLKKVIYAGYIELPNWNIPLQEAQHEGLITLEMYQRIQNRLKSTGKAPARKDLSKDFPLRGFIQCDDCSKPLTACWSKGEFKRYAYYLCNHKGCASKGKSNPKAKLEGEFEELLMKAKPAKPFVKATSIMFHDLWNKRLGQFKEKAKSIKKQLTQTDVKIKQLVDRILSSNNQTVINAYEKQITDLERQKLILAEKSANSDEYRHPYEEMIERCMNFIANPHKLWLSDKLEHKRTVLKLTFSEHLTYNRKTGYRTPNFSLPFKVLDGLKTQNKEMVPARGVELRTY